LHSFFVILGFFYEVDNVKYSNSSFGVSIPEKEPIVVSMSIDVILNNEVVIIWVNFEVVGFTNVSRFEVRVNTV
jgi:hypothetical protein